MGGGVQVATGARGLEVPAVEPAGGVDGGDHAAGGHGLSGPGGDVAGALDVPDRQLHRRGGGLRARLGDRFGGGLAPAATGVLRGHRGRGGEVGGVVVGVHAVGAGHGLRVRIRRRASGGRGLVGVGGAVAEQVHEPVGTGHRASGGGQGLLAVGEHDRPGDARRVERGGEVGGGQRGTAARVGPALDQEVAARGDGPGQRHRAGDGSGAGRGAVLQGPAGEVHRLDRGVVELDELVGVDGVGRAAVGVGLVDDHVRPVRGGVHGHGQRRGEQGRGQSPAQGQGEQLVHGGEFLQWGQGEKGRERSGLSRRDG